MISDTSDIIAPAIRYVLSERVRRGELMKKLSHLDKYAALFHEKMGQTDPLLHPA